MTQQAERKLFLDDQRACPFGWDVVRSFAAFVRYIEANGVPHTISFDHDLAFEHYPLAEQHPTDVIPYDSYSEKTGYHAAKWLIERNTFPTVAVVHTMNPVGAQNIIAALGGKCMIIYWPHGRKYPIRVWRANPQIQIDPHKSSC